MLMDTMSDPRRANWLTITSMAEDLCWPEDSGSSSSSRPSWELEAEILRLTTRLMMRERELRQTKNQLKTQTTKAQQQIADLRWKMDEKEEQMKALLIQKDSEMQTIVSQLLLFESELRQEQNRIEDLLQEKDAVILEQQQEIKRLRELMDSSGSVSAVRNPEFCRSRMSRDSIRSWDLTNCADISNGSSEDSAVAVKKLKDGLARIRAIQDLTNVVKSRPEKNGVSDSKHENPVGEKRRIPHKTPQKMKDLKAKRVASSQKTHRQAAGEMCGQIIL